MDAQKPKILVIDDDAANRYAKARVLQKEGFAVLEAATGGDGLKLAATEGVQVVILDVKLPDINGFEVCRRIKANPATAAISVLQTSASFVKGTDQARGLEGGADSYLVQPIEPIVLVATVKALLRMRRAEQRQAELFELEKRARSKAAANEELFNLVVDNVRDYAIIITDKDGRVMVWNNGARRILGYEESEIKGRTIDQIFTPEDLAANFPQIEMKTALATGRSDDERWHVRRDQTRFWASGVMHSLRDENGDLRGFVKILRDMTERKLLEEKRAAMLREEQDARAHAEGVNRMKDEFLATLSHELRTPLTSIVGWTRLLQSGALDGERVLHGLKVIERNAKAQAQLVEDLLDVSRIITGKMPLRAEHIQLDAVVEAAVEAVRLAAEAKGIRLSARIHPQPFVGDPDRLQQVLWNLLSNSIKFTPKGGWIDVDMSLDDSSVVVRVSDSGRGIGPDFLPYVFERFRQADSSTTRIHGGLGLGLAIVRHLVEMHGGTIRAESPGENKGSIFTLTLPITSVATKSSSRNTLLPTPEQNVEWERYPSLAGFRILVVEDEADARELIVVVLEERGAIVDSAGTAKEALQLFDKITPDAIVSDIGLPGEDGYALINKIRERPIEKGGATPAIALTAYAHDTAKHRVLQAGYHQHLAKPVDPLRLIESVAKLVVGSRDAQAKLKPT